VPELVLARIMVLLSRTQWLRSMLCSATPDFSSHMWQCSLTMVPMQWLVYPMYTSPCLQVISSTHLQDYTVSQSENHNLNNHQHQTTQLMTDNIAQPMQNR
jgi:hypothetical protein